MTDRLPYRIKFGSWVPKVFGHDCVTIRRTIYCRKHRISTRALAHEYCHVEQWARYGVVGFLARYLWQQLRRGYTANPFEAAAHRYATAHEHEFRGMP